MAIKIKKIVWNIYCYGKINDGLSLAEGFAAIMDLLADQEKQMIGVLEGMKKTPLMKGGYDKDEQGNPIMGTLHFEAKEFNFEIGYQKALSDAIKEISK